jgi:hypothetical protein
MPYIKQVDRTADLIPSNPGELNFVLTRIVFDYWKERGNYQAINDVLGALEGAKLEFYRRVAAPYEDTKIVQNGDVYL